MLYTFFRRSFLATVAIVIVCKVILVLERVEYQSEGANEQNDDYEILGYVYGSSLR